MHISQIPHVSEEYYCQSCESAYNQNDVKKNWKCPTCNELIEIRVKTEQLDNSCFRVEVKYLENADMVLLARNYEFKEIIDIIDNGNNIRIALKEYGVISLDQNCLILKLNGGWYH